MTDTLQAVRERLATAFYNVIPPESHTDSHIWHTYCHTLAEIALQYITTPQAAQEEVVERVNAFEVAIREHMRSYGSSFSVIDRYAAQVKQKREALIATLTPPSQPTAKEAVNA